MDRLLSMRVFRRVVEEGGFAAAARALELSPAVVTRLVADLESHLGTRLLQRTTRRVVVTDVGAAYAERLGTILAELDEADAEVSQHNRELAGDLHLSASPALAGQVLAPLVTAFRRQHPRIVFDIHVGVADAAVVERHDITFLSAPAGADSNIVARRLATVTMFLAATPGYLKRHGVPRQPEDLAGHQCLMWRTPGGAPRSWTLVRNDDPSEVREVKLRPVLSSTVDVLLQAALDDAGIVATTERIAGSPLARGDLVRVLQEWNVGRLDIFAALPSRHFIPHRARAFLDFVGSQVR
jgi:DNA-binding transcriptional LysR family regulator